MHNIRIGDIRWQIPDFLFDGNGNVCFISYHFRDIRKNNNTLKVLTLEMKVKVKE